MRCALTVWLCVCSSAAGAWADTTEEDGHQIKIAVLDLQPGLEVSQDVVVTVSGLIGAQLDKTGVFAVVTEEDVKQMVSFDQMKTALTCDEQASCLSEIGQALGVPYMLTGTLGKLGSQLALNLTLIDISKARALKRESAIFADVDALLAGLPATVERAVAALLYQQKGTLMVLASEEGAVVELDGKAIGTTPLAETEVPSGPHRVVVSKQGFIQYAVDVAIRPREQAAVRATLSPSPEFLAAYKARTGAQRAVAWGTAIGAGAGVLAGGGGIVAFFLHREALRSQKGIASGANVEADGAEYAALASEFYGGITAAVVGVGLGATSAWLFATAEDEERYDRLGTPTLSDGSAR